LICIKVSLRSYLTKIHANLSARRGERFFYVRMENMGRTGMRYIDHIRNMSDDQLAYFLNAIQPEITLWSLSMMRALSRKPYKGVDALNGTNGDTRTLMSILYKDFDYEMKLMDEERNQSLDDLHDYASGNDLKRALGHPELQKERELPKAPADTQQAESEGEK